MHTELMLILMNSKSTLRSSTALDCLAKPRASAAASSALQASLRNVTLTMNQTPRAHEP